MAKMTIKDVTYEGTPEELREIAQLLGEEVAEEGQAAEVGDYVKATKCLSGHKDGYVGYGKLGQGLINLGAVGEVISADSQGVYAKFPEGTKKSVGTDAHNFYLRNKEFEVVEKETLKVGDKVEVIDGSKSRYADLGTGEVGEITDISEVFSNGQYYEVTTEDDYDRFPAEALRKLSEGEVAEKEAFKAGDYVVGINATQYNVTNDEMRLGEVVKDEVDGRMSVKVLRHKITTYENDATYPVQSKYFRKATDEEIAEATAPKFEEGDYARTLPRGQFSDISEGEVVSILNTEVGEDGDEYPVYAETPEGETDFFRPQDLEKLEGKDAERIEQFAKAGRKLNEFKKGDIVRVKDTMTSPYIREGELVTVAWADGTTAPEVSTGNGCRAFAKVELIAPVESRVDI